MVPLDKPYPTRAAGFPEVAGGFQPPAGESVAGFPLVRPRRLRLNAALRGLVRETSLAASDFIYPLFVRHGKGVQEPIASMPGVYQWSVDRLPAEIESIARLGIPAVILFGIPARKDPLGSENYDPEGVIPQAIRAAKRAVPEMIVISDMCFCEYTDHGHCGVINAPARPATHRRCPKAIC